MFIISVQVFDKLRQEAMSSIIDRNPRAFKPKIAQSPVRTIEYSLKWQLNLLDCAEVISLSTAVSMLTVASYTNHRYTQPKSLADLQMRSVHHKGCHCKKSHCLKKYCECFQVRSRLKCACCLCDHHMQPRCWSSHVGSCAAIDIVRRLLRYLMPRGCSTINDSFVPSCAWLMISRAQNGIVCSENCKCDECWNVPGTHMRQTLEEKGMVPARRKCNEQLYVCSIIPLRLA